MPLLLKETVPVNARLGFSVISALLEVSSVTVLPRAVTVVLGAYCAGLIV